MKKVGTTNWGFVILPYGFKESHIPMLVEKLKEVMKSPISNDLIIVTDSLDFNLDDQLTTDIKEMIAKFGSPNIVGEKSWKGQFIAASLKGLQSDDPRVREVGQKTVNRIAHATIEQQIFLRNVGLPNLQDLCKMLRDSFN